jgi:hypothetical protein
MVISNPDEDGKWLSYVQELSEKYKDFKFLHELEYEQEGSAEDTKLCANNRTVPISAG